MNDIYNKDKMSITVTTVIRIKAEKTHLDLIEKYIDITDEELDCIYQHNRDGYLDMIVYTKNQECPERIFKIMDAHKSDKPYGIEYKSISWQEDTDTLLIEKKDTDYFKSGEAINGVEILDEEDYKWKELRQRISHHLIDTDEEHPYVFKPNDMPVIGENWDETVGLSTLELPHIDKIFQVPGDGTIWFHIEGEYEDLPTCVNDGGAVNII